MAPAQPLQHPPAEQCGDGGPDETDPYCKTLGTYLGIVSRGTPRALRLAGLGERTRLLPVILLSARSGEESALEGLEAGADDYLTKPFEFRELLMRIRALARRPVETYQILPVLKFADMEMNLQTKEFFREGRRIQLTPREFALMEFFLRNPGRVISKTEISERVWNLNFDTGTNVIEVYVNFLRKKVDKGFSRKLIHTQFKTGYVLREEN